MGRAQTPAGFRAPPLLSLFNAFLLLPFGLRCSSKYVAEMLVMGRPLVTALCPHLQGPHRYASSHLTLVTARKVEAGEGQ